MNASYFKSTVSVPNFSYNFIEADTILTIPLFQQMLVYQEVEVELTGELEIDGEVGVLE
jgi:hypothetical protein